MRHLPCVILALYEAVTHLTHPSFQLCSWLLNLSGVQRERKPGWPGGGRYVPPREGEGRGMSTVLGDCSVIKYAVCEE